MNESKIIFGYDVARYLIKLKHIVIDIKKDHNNPKGCVFVFSNTVELNSDLEDFINKRKQRKN